MSDLQTSRIRAEEARQLLQNPLFRDAFAEVKSHLDMAALSCDPDNKEKAQRIVLSQQLLHAVKREIERKIEDGEMASIQLAELEQRRGIKRLFQR